MRGNDVKFIVVDRATDVKGSDCSSAVEELILGDLSLAFRRSLALSFDPLSRRGSEEMSTKGTPGEPENRDQNDSNDPNVSLGVFWSRSSFSNVETI